MSRITIAIILALTLALGATGLLLKKSYKTNGVQAAQIAQAKKDFDAQVVRANKEAATARAWKGKYEEKIAEQEHAAEQQALRLANFEEAQRRAQVAEDKLEDYIRSKAHETNNPGNQLVPGPVVERLWSGEHKARSGNGGAKRAGRKAVPAR